MPKRLLRGIIDFGDNRISEENLNVNYQRISRSNFDWNNPDERKLFQFIKEYVQANHEPPSAAVIRDFFERSNELTVTEKLLDVKAVEVYTRSHYETLLKDLLNEQIQNKVRKLLSDVDEISTKGRIVGVGKEKKTLRGVRDGLQYYNEKIYEIVPPETNSRTEGDVLNDAGEAWEEYQTAEINKGKVYGRFTGIEQVDVACHGIKKGEMWVHAAAPGGLKCLAGDVMVFDHRTNRRRRLKELYDCKDLPTVTALKDEGQSSILVPAKASHLVQNGEREVFDLTLRSGRSIGATGNHRFLTPSGWVELSHLKEGDFVATPNVMRTVPADKQLYSASEVKVLGYLIGDGTITEYITFTQKSPFIRDDFTGCLKDLGLIEGSADYENPNFSVHFPEGRTPYVRVSHGLGDRWHRVISPVRTLLERTGLYGTDSYSKRIPSEFFGLSDELAAAFLGALWATDGSCSTGDYLRKARIAEGKAGGPQSSYVISYASVCRGLCLDIQSLLLQFGIPSTITKTVTEVEGEPYCFWTVRVTTNPGKRKFCEKIRVFGKELKFAHLLSRLPSKDSTLVPSCLLPDGDRVRINGSWRYARTAARHSTTVTSEVARSFGVDVGDIYWDRVQEINLRGVEMTYDLSVPNHHTFVANDIITHNTTFAMNWAYNQVTRYNANVLYVSLEMKYEHLRRLACVMHTSNGAFLAQGYKPLDYRKVRDGELNAEEKLFYQLALKDFESNPSYRQFKVWAPDRDVTVQDIRVQAELIHRTTPIGLIIIDHGGLVTSAKSHKDYTIELNSVLRDTKKMALHFNGGEGIPICMLFQVNRQGKEAVDKLSGTDAEGKYSMTSLAYANEAERSADYITTSYINDELKRQGAAVLCNPKNRDNDPFALTKVRVDFTCRRMMTWDQQDQLDMGHSELSQADLELTM